LPPPLQVLRLPQMPELLQALPLRQLTPSATRRARAAQDKF
jgi:hypothetical protein